LFSVVLRGELHKTRMFIENGAYIRARDSEGRGLMHYVFWNCFKQKNPNSLFKYHPLEILKYVLSLDAKTVEELFQQRSQQNESPIGFSLKQMVKEVGEQNQMNPERVDEACGFVVQAIELVMNYLHGGIFDEVMGQIPMDSGQYEPIKTVMCRYVVKKKVNVAFAVVKKYQLSFNNGVVLRNIVEFLE